MTSPARHRWTAAAGLLASLTGLPVLLVAASGPPTVGGLPSWGWMSDGLRDQYLPVEPLLAALGLLAWALWVYAVLVTMLRVLAVAAARRGLAGSVRLLSFSNLVTLAPLRSLVDAAVGVSLLASASHAVAAPVTLAGPPAVVRTVDGSAGWDRAQQLLGAVHPSTPVTQPGVGTGAQLQPPAVISSPVEDPECPPSQGQVYLVREGDSLWRIAERELGDGHRWQEIFAANHGRRMPDGQLLRDSGLILPGWQLLLPPHNPADRPPATPRLAPVDPGPVVGRTEPPPPPARPSPSPGSASTTAEHPDGQHDERRDVVELPSGSMVGISLAVGIAAALLVAGLRRRRRRRPLWPPTPAERAAVRRMGETARLLAFAAARATHPAADAAGQQPTEPPPGPRVPGPARDLRDPTPARVAIAEQHGDEVAVDLAGFGAIAITGAGADGLARACLVGLLAAGDSAAVEVLLVGERLIPGAGGFPGLRRAAGLPGALNVLEAELVHRARLLEANDTPDFATHRREHPDDPLPALVLVADGVSLERAGRLAAILAQGPRLGVGALLPGTAVDGGAQLVLDETGRVQTAIPWELGDQQLVGARACSLTTTEAAELLGVLAHSRSDDDVDGAVVELSHQDSPPAAEEPALAAPAAEPMAVADPAGVAAADDPAGLSAESARPRRRSPCGCSAPCSSPPTLVSSAAGCELAPASCWLTT